MRNSKSKTAIVELLEQSEEALSHKDIQTQLSDLCDRVTVYRVLDRLVNEGQVHKVIDFEGVMRFATCHQCSSHVHKHDHVHFSCEICHKVTCMEAVQPKIKLPAGFQIKDSLHVLSGVCASCAA